MATKRDRDAVAMAPAHDGALVICDTVLAEIAYLEAMGTPGIVPLREGFVQGVLRRKKLKGVLVEASANEVAFLLTLGVREGVRIPEAANEVRRRVAAAVTAKTGYAVRAVNVLVDHVVFDKGS
ncbi:MAG TPA: Asp23/Gls24 family envelope stress response protein [Planctomycetota bacterium]|nr:Asp23/Gls24 family envelope stress response protein [Planctomycetota bacterium]